MWCLWILNCLLLVIIILCVVQSQSDALTSASSLQMNSGGHVILCGQISQYNKDVPYPPPLSQETQETLQRKNITRERFMVLNYMSKADAALFELSQCVKSGQVKVRRLTVCVSLFVCKIYASSLSFFIFSLHHLVACVSSVCRCWKLW